MFNYFKYFINGLVVCGILSSSVAYAESCPRNVQPIEKGQVANCSGYLFSPQAEEKAAKAVETAKLREQENEILNRRLELYITQSNTLAKEIARKQVTEDLYRGVYFIVGAVITGVIASNVRD